jgi:NIMA (never in mitosis gene a)-related kinase
LASLNDDFIIGFKDTFYDDVSSMLCIVMEYASGGDVLKKINGHIKSRTRYSEDEVWKALVHMAKGKEILTQG